MPHEAEAIVIIAAVKVKIKANLLRIQQFTREFFLVVFTMYSVLHFPFSLTAGDEWFTARNSCSTRNLRRREVGRQPL